tara:strand:+ start:84 stop:581 length:498 start_codon:yes stop_codon:yes gene_type:complete
MLKFERILLTCGVGILTAGGFALGYSMSEMKVIRQRVELIEQNTEIIKSISGVAMTQSAVSDLLIRVSHYTDGHQGGNHICPECSGREFEPGEEIEDVDVELEESHDQVMADLREIESSVDSLTFGNVNQIAKLETMLQRKRKNAAVFIFPSKNSEFFGGGDGHE